MDGLHTTKCSLIASAFSRLCFPCQIAVGHVWLVHELQLFLFAVAAKLVPVGFGIRKMQITAVIEDAKVESMDSIIEEEIVRDGESEFIQSIDVVSFNKL